MGIEISSNLIIKKEKGREHTGWNFQQFKQQ
jgi:hypothetical protein